MILGLILIEGGKPWFVVRCLSSVAFILIKIVLNIHKNLFIYYLYYLDGQAVSKNFTNSQENTFNRVLQKYNCYRSDGWQIIQKRFASQIFSYKSCEVFLKKLSQRASWLQCRGQHFLSFRKYLKEQLPLNSVKNTCVAGSDATFRFRFP